MTSDVLALIDGALDDWATSPDAMRWTSEPAESHWARIDRAVRDYAAYGQAFYLVIPRRSGHAAWTAWQAEYDREPVPLTRVGISHEPEPDPARQRALDARRNRNTGPALPPLGRGR